MDHLYNTSISILGCNIDIFGILVNLNYYGLLVFRGPIYSAGGEKRFGEWE